MGKYGLIPLAVAVAGGILWGGCRAGGLAWTHPDQSRQQTANPASAGEDTKGLEAYLAEGAASPRIFLQFDVGRSEAAPRPYEREIQSLGSVEGSLIGGVEFPLSQYLDPHSRHMHRPRVDWPRAGRGAVDAFFIEFKPALMEWPAEGQEGKSVEAQAQITAFERDGVPFAYGTCRRTMRVAGFESAKTAGQTFDDSVRMEASTELSFGWLATIRVDETAWYARGVGLVRREDRFNGRALWLFRFQGASRYELGGEALAHLEMVADDVGASAKRAKSLKGEKREKSLDDVKGHSNHGVRDVASANPGWWSRLAICLERSGRRMRISGMAVEWAGNEVEPTLPMDQR